MTSLLAFYHIFIYLFFRTNSVDVLLNPITKHRKLNEQTSKYLPPFGIAPSGKFIFPSLSINYDFAASVENEINFSTKPQMLIETTLQKKEQ
jgi:uncharacterized membrane protein